MREGIVPYTSGVWRVRPGHADDFIAAWREFDGWKERIGRVRELLDGFEPATLELVAHID